MEVRYTPAAFAQIARIRAARELHGKRLVFDLVMGCIRSNVATPELALRGNTLLEGRTRYDLAGIRRERFAGVGRVFYVVAPAADRAIVLWVGRKLDPADPADAYRELSEALRAGLFDDAFAELDIARPAG